MTGINAHLAIEMKGGETSCHEWAIDWNLMEVDTDAVVLRVAVEGHPELQERIGAIFDARNHRARAEGSLLDVFMVVLRVLIED